MSLTVQADAPTPAPEPKPHLSFSALKSFADCGKRFELERVVGVPQAPSHALAGGRAVHKATEAWDRWFATHGDQ